MTPNLSPDWMAAGLCRQLDPHVAVNLFFPGNSPGVATAVATCQRCPVQIECAEYALTNRIDFGVWGGLSERARRNILKKRRPPRPPPVPIEHGTNRGYTRHWRHHERACDACAQAHVAATAVAKQAQRTKKRDAA